MAPNPNPSYYVIRKRVTQYVRVLEVIISRIRRLIYYDSHTITSIVPKHNEAVIG